MNDDDDDDEAEEEEVMVADEKMIWLRSKYNKVESFKEL